MEVNRSNRIPDQDWEARKEDIRRAYLDEDKKLDGPDGVIRLMSTRYGFTASKSQYETRLRRWGFRKYAKGDEWQSIARILDQRKEQGKASEVYISGEPVSLDKIRKEVARNRSKAATPHNDGISLPRHITIKTPPQPTIEANAPAILRKRPRLELESDSSSTSSLEEIPREHPASVPQLWTEITRRRELSIQPLQEFHPESPPLPKLTRVQRVRPTPVKTWVNSISPADQEIPVSTSSWREQNHHQYQSIREDQCRLLIIRPGSEEDEVIATLLVIDDNHLETGYYPYEALSYAWGNPTATHMVTMQEPLPSRSESRISDLLYDLDLENCPEYSIAVTRNLHEALKNLRRPDTPLLLWVDALCINMADLVERRHQMQKMSLIFRNAVNVCIWLGSGDYSSSEAIKFTKKLVNLETIESPFDDQDYSTSWIWFFQLLQRPWFSRRWVVMEVALAKEATIHCGSDVVHWDDFRDAIAISYQHFSSLGSYLKLPKVSALHDLSPRYLRAKSLVDVTSNMIRRMRDGAVQSTIDLETLVSSLCDLYSPDPRDTIFAFLCICKEFNTLQEGSERPSTLVPDYTKHPIRIYQRFVKWVIATSNSLDIICRRWAQFCDGLPSWILDFDPDSPFLHRRPSDSLVGLPGRSHYMASGKSHPIVTFKNHRPHQKSASMSIPTRSLLIAIGRDIGRLRWSSQPILDGVIPRTSLERLGWTQQLSEEMQRVPDKLWRTLVADRGPNGSFAPAYYHRAALFCLLHSAEDGHINTEKLLRGDQSTIVHEFLQRMEIVTRNRVILHGVLAPEFRGPSSHGREPDFVGIGPPDSQPGDVVAILYGCSVPVILRHNEGGGRRFIGEAFIYGYMDGEVPLDDSTKETFTLI